MSAASELEKPKVSLLNNPKVRNVAYQVLLCGVIAVLAYGAVTNAIENLRRAKIASGFGFWDQTAGFDISQSLIEYSSSASTYGRAFWVGLLNTLLVAGLGIVFATILGFIVGIARQSKNWLVSHLASGYVELIRNLPLLLQLLFWYNAVLKALPEMRDSWSLPGSIFLNNRGFFAPSPIFQPAMQLVAGAFIAGIIGAIAGQIFGHKTKSTVIGAATGAAAGAVVAGATGKYDGCVPNGGRISLKLNQPMTVQQSV